MFQAILHGKRRNTFLGLQTSDNWRAVYRGTEDFLTASVFTRLSYLEAPIFWAVLRSAISRNLAPGTVMPTDVGDLLERKFWPRWTLNGSTQEPATSEPDIFLAFEQLSLIVEAKVDDTPGQHASQWAAELAAYLRRDDLDTSIPVWVLAIGGLGNQPAQVALQNMRVEADRILHEKYGFVESQVQLAACSWSQLMISLVEESAKISDPASYRIVEDAIEILRFHGFRNTRWLDELPQALTLLRFTDSSSELFGRWAGEKRGKEVKRPPWYSTSALLGIDDASFATIGRMIHGR